MTSPIPRKERSLRIALILVSFSVAADIIITLQELLSQAEPALIPLLHLGLLGLCLVLLAFTLRGVTQSGALAQKFDRHCFNHLPIPAVVVDRQGRICSANQAAAQLVYRNISALVGQPVHGLFHPPHISSEECSLCQHIKTGKELAATDFAFTDQHWQQISLSKLSPNKTGQLLQLHLDISSRKQVEEQMALVFDGAELGYWDWDYASGKHQVNQRWLDILGLEPDELDDYINDWDQRIHPEDRKRVYETITRHIKANKPYVLEFRMQHKQGHYIWIQGSGAVVEHDPISGKPKRLCGTHQNITARKQSEYNLQATYQIISQSPSVVLKWKYAEGLPIEFATENVVHLLGYTVEQLSNERVLYLNLIHPEDLPTFTEEINSCQNNSNCFEAAHLPYRIMSANGDIKWVQDHKVLKRNDQGQITGYQGLVTDITHQRQQNRAIHNIISSSLEKHSPSTLDNITLLTTETLAADCTIIGEIKHNGDNSVLSSYDSSENNSDYKINSTIYTQLSRGNICKYAQNIFRRRLATVPQYTRPNRHTATKRQATDFRLCDSHVPSRHPRPAVCRRHP